MESTHAEHAVAFAAAAQPGLLRPPALGHVIVAVDPVESAADTERLLAAAAQFAAAHQRTWTVLWVEVPDARTVQSQHLAVIGEIVRRAGIAGADTVSLVAPSTADALREYASLFHRPTLIVGAPRRTRVPGWLRTSTAAQVLHHDLDANLVVMARAPPNRHGNSHRMREPRRMSVTLLTRYAIAVGITALCTLIALPIHAHFALIDMVMIYLLGTACAALRLGRGPAVVTALANIPVLDYFFVPPRFSFRVSDPHFLITFAVMLGVALVLANLVAAVRQQMAAAASRERRTSCLYTLSKELAVMRDAHSMATLAERHIAESTQSRVSVVLRDTAAGAQHRARADRMVPNPAVCEWVMQHGARAGADCQEFAAEPYVYMPLLSNSAIRGVLVIDAADLDRPPAFQQARLLEALADQLAQALTRVALQEEAEAATLSADHTALRNTLLASISHDLRTPLAAIAGAGSIMAQESFPMDAHRRATLGRLVEDKARDMTQLVTNVLELTRLETAPALLRRDWHLLEDLVGLTLRQNEARLAGWEVAVDIPGDVPMVLVEAGLIVQLLSNLVENCTKHTPRGGKVLIGARTAPTLVVITVQDNGTGIPEADVERLFEKFERGKVEGTVTGVGLGLAICRAIARLHQGGIRAVRVPTGGTRFELTLPRIDELPVSTAALA